MCRLDHVTFYALCDISALRAGIVSTGAGKSRQALPHQSSSHGSAMPRRSSHFDDRGASLLGRRLRVRRLLAKVPKRRDAVANLAFASSIFSCEAFVSTFAIRFAFCLAR